MLRGIAEGLAEAPRGTLVEVQRRQRRVVHRQLQAVLGAEEDVYGADLRFAVEVFARDSDDEIGEAVVVHVAGRERVPELVADLRVVGDTRRRLADVLVAATAGRADVAGLLQARRRAVDDVHLARVGLAVDRRAVLTDREVVEAVAVEVAPGPVLAEAGVPGGDTLEGRVDVRDLRVVPDDAVDEDGAVQHFDRTGVCFAVDGLLVDREDRIGVPVPVEVGVGPSDPERPCRLRCHRGGRQPRRRDREDRNHQMSVSLAHAPSSSLIVACGPRRVSDRPKKGHSRPPLAEGIRWPVAFRTGASYARVASDGGPNYSMGSSDNRVSRSVFCSSKSSKLSVPAA